MADEPAGRVILAMTYCKPAQLLVTWWALAKTRLAGACTKGTKRKTKESTGSKLHHGLAQATATIHNPHNGHKQWNMSHIRHTRSNRGGDRAKAAEGVPPAESMQSLVESALPQLLPGLMKDAVKEAMEVHLQESQNTVKELKERMDALLQRVGELEKEKEDIQPTEAVGGGRGSCPTMEEMRNNLDGEIKMKMIE